MEKKNLERYLKTQEEYARILGVIADMADKSMNRPLWAFRPSHTRIMKVWQSLLDEWKRSEKFLP